MDTVSKEAARKELQPPLFHVFSETLFPCPPEDTGIFDEFPSWPVHQVRTRFLRYRDTLPLILRRNCLLVVYSPFLSADPICMAHCTVSLALLFARVSHLCRAKLLKIVSRQSECEGELNLSCATTRTSTNLVRPMQIPGCRTTEVPKDCPEKQAGLPCKPKWPGVFHVIGMPLVLHVGPDVHNALTCMIHADGLLMGCSTFGHIAGVLSHGISFFSMHCSGHHSPVQYKTIPPIAVAERGHQWVPVAGSWHDPVLNSTEILSGALDIHLGNKGWV